MVVNESKHTCLFQLNVCMCNTELKTERLFSISSFYLGSWKVYGCPLCMSRVELWKQLNWINTISLLNKAEKVGQSLDELKPQ